MWRIASLFGLCMGVGLTLGIGTIEGWAQPSHTNDSLHPPATREVQRIEQPIHLKVGVTTLGVILMGLELWWFLWHKPTHREIKRYSNS
jgi:plastocyanin domain-containing protein